ncbi:alpha/beta fold hydrolase [Rhizobium setariae]|uniref:alpha/beta fold hydrolase n=1 Tax=Rhizobium setariae TaxID=2801340 RepID=UPI001FEF2816|nr:alpha/beta hydrolase [Rhizobium setariae]
MDILNASPGNAVPPNHFAGYFKTFDGLELRYAVFRSGSRLPKGTVVLLQGRNESIEKYFETIQDLNAMGLWVATFDWRGQGGSPRLLKNRSRGHIRRFSDLERDLDAFLEAIVLPDAKLPFSILGHSMGALVALKAAPRLANRIERMVLCAPFIDAAGLRLPRWLLKFLANAATTFGFGWVQFGRDRRNKPFSSNKVTSDPARFERNRLIVKTCPQLGIGPPTARWISTMIDTIETINSIDYLKRIEVPSLVIAPSADKVVPYQGLEGLSRKFRASKLITIAGSEHEILQERDIFRGQALAAIDAFIPGSDADPSIYTGA